METDWTTAEKREVIEIQKGIEVIGLSGVRPGRFPRPRLTAIQVVQQPLQNHHDGKPQFYQFDWRLIKCDLALK